MKSTLSHHSSLLLAAAVMTGMSSLHAAPPLPPPAVDANHEAAQFSTDVSPWTFSAGATVRSIDADVHFARPAPLHWQSFVRREPRGRGDVGFANGSSVVYDDGFVGPPISFGPLTNFGLSNGQINSGSQISGTGRTLATGQPIFNAAFHSSTTRYSVDTQLHGADASDSDVGVGPYVNLSYAVFTGSQGSVILNWGWSFVQTEHGTGPTALGFQNVVRSKTEFTYNYDFFTLNGARPTGFPHTVGLPNSALVNDGALYDATSVPSPTGARSPRKNTRSSSNVVASFVPVATSHLDVTLNEIVFSAEYQRKLGNRIHVGVAVGPTLNVIDSDFDAQVAWFLNGGGNPVAVARYHDSSTEVKMGVMGQVNIVFNVTARLYLEAHGSYRWVDSVNVGGSAASVSVDPSSWEGGLGIGIRL